MRDTTFAHRTTGEITHQSMITEQGGSKGIKRILQERGWWDNRMLLECKACKEDIPLDNRRAYYVDFAGDPIFANDDLRFTEQCCARGCLRRQPDFVAQKEWLREILEDAG
jgi:hypothetical protein